MATKFELVNGGRNTIIAINKIMKKHQIAIQRSIALAMTNTRLRASEHIIENTTDWVNPYMARKFQPSKPGRLTSRTGKLKYMLKHHINRGNRFAYWSGFGKTLVKEDTIALRGQIRLERQTRTTMSFVGTYRVHITGHPRLWDMTRGRPRETSQTLAIRFQWEKGIRGQSRPIFRPVVDLVSFDMSNYMKSKDEALRGLNI